MKFKSQAKIYLILITCSLAVGHALGADSSATKAKQKAESEDYVFIGSHDEIVEKAKKEEKLGVIRLLGPDSFKNMIAAFRQKYPFVTDVTEFEFRGTEAPQRFILELQAGRGREWDVFDVAPELHGFA